MFQFLCVSTLYFITVNHSNPFLSNSVSLLQCSFINRYNHFRKICCIHIQGPEDVGSNSSEVLVLLYQSTQCHITEVCNLKLMLWEPQFASYISCNCQGFRLSTPFHTFRSLSNDLAVSAIYVIPLFKMSVVPWHFISYCVRCVFFIHCFFMTH
jgi:hypothetical protein